MPSLRSSIRKRLEAEEAAQQQDDAGQADNQIEEANPVEAEDDNPVELAAGAALQAKLDEQPDPEVDPEQELGLPDEDEYEAQFDEDIAALELQAADAAAQTQGYRRGSRDYADAVASRLQQDTPRRERSSVSMAMPVSRESPSWSSGRATPAKTELTAEERAFCREQDYDVEEYRRNKTKMNAMKKAGVLQD
jgi:hypothetical protein